MKRDRGWRRRPEAAAAVTQPLPVLYLSHHSWRGCQSTGALHSGLMIDAGAAGPGPQICPRLVLASAATQSCGHHGRSGPPSLGLAEPLFSDVTRSYFQEEEEGVRARHFLCDRGELLAQQGRVGSPLAF